MKESGNSMKRSPTSIDDTVLKKLYEDKDGMALYEYSPTAFAPLYCNFEPLRFVRRIRLLDEYFRRGRYKVYYLAFKGRLVGYTVLAPGGRRLSFSTAADLVAGPMFVAPECRGRGYNALLHSLSLPRCAYPYEYVYCWIDKSNVASLRSIQKQGWEKVGELNNVGKSRRLVPAENGHDEVYRLRNPMRSGGK